MNRRELISRIESLGAEFIREGSRHTIYRNPVTGQTMAIPRHQEIRERLARLIIRDAEQRKPGE